MRVLPVDGRASVWTPPRCAARRHRRIPLRVGVSVKHSAGVCFEETRDISESGVFVETTTSLELGARVEVELFLPGGFDIRCGALVRWTRGLGGDGVPPPGVGLEFVDLGAPERAVIAALVALSLDGA